MLSSVRKFGLGYCDLRTMLKNVAVLLGILFVFIGRENRIRIPILWYMASFVAGVCFYYVYLISMVWFVFVRCRETGDLYAASVVCSLGAVCQTGVMKVIFMFFNNAEIKGIIDAYLEFDSLEQTPRFSANLHKNLRNVKMRAIFFWLFRVVGCLVYVIAPIVLPGPHLEEDMFVIYGLEPLLESPYYEIAFTLETAGLYFTVITETSTSAFITVLVGYIEAQLLTLSSELDSIWEDSENVSADCVTANRDKIINEHVRTCLDDIVKKHVTNINLLGEVVNMWRAAVAVEIGLLMLGLTAELLGGLENTFLQVPYTLSQIVIGCYLGQKLLDASLVLEKSIYFCKWENFDKSNQRTVYLMLLNAQKSLTLSVGGFTFLGCTFFMSVVKTIYSAYTTLRSRM